MIEKITQYWSVSMEAGGDEFRVFYSSGAEKTFSFTTLPGTAKKFMHEHTPAEINGEGYILWIYE